MRKPAVAADGAQRATQSRRNLSNEYHYAQMTGQANASDIAGPAPPRMYGITLGYNFR